MHEYGKTREKREILRSEYRLVQGQRSARRVQFLFHSDRFACSFLVGFGLHVTGNVNKTPVVDAEVAAQSERKAKQEYFAYDDLRSGKL